MKYIIETCTYCGHPKIGPHGDGCRRKRRVKASLKRSLKSEAQELFGKLRAALSAPSACLW